MKVFWRKGDNLPNRNALVWQRIISGAFVLLILAFVIYLVWHHFADQNNPKGFIKKVTSPTVQAAQKSLKTGDYENYQAFETEVAQSYLTNNDIKDAESIMTEVFTKVPAEKINDLSYMIMTRIQDVKRDYAKEKYYYRQYIKYLQAKGDTAGAQQTQQEMDSL